MDDFLRFFEDIRTRVPMHIEIGYSSVVDWMIVIYRGRSYAESQEEIVNVQNCDMEMCFALAQVAFKEWLMKEYGGY